MNNDRHHAAICDSYNRLFISVRNFRSSSAKASSRLGLFGQI